MRVSFTQSSVSASKYLNEETVDIKKSSNGTIMIDINTICIIDILNSRDTQNVAEWLIVRDGSISFKAEIEAAHPNVIQVNDRFYIIKNLVKAIKKTLQRLIIGWIDIPLTSAEAKQRYEYLTSLTRKEKIIEAKKFAKKEKHLRK